MQEIVKKIYVKKELNKLLKSNQKAKIEAAKAKEELERFVTEHEKQIFLDDNTFLSEFGTVARRTKTDFSCKSLTWKQLMDIIGDDDLSVFLKKGISAGAVKSLFDTSEMKKAEETERGSLTRLREKFKVGKFVKTNVFAYKS